MWHLGWFTLNVCFFIEIFDVPVVLWMSMFHNRNSFRFNYVGTRYQNNQRYGVGDDRPYRTVPIVQTTNYLGSGIRGGEVYNIKPKLVTSERCYPPNNDPKPRYATKMSHPPPYSSDMYSNRSLL